MKPEAKNMYNIGNSLYSQGRTKEAISAYESAVQLEDRRMNKARNAYYNLGNSYFAEKNFEKSIDAYKEGLKLNPSDIQAKQNPRSLLNNI